MDSSDAPRAFLEFFRRDMGATFKRILIPAGILVFVGAPCVCFGAAVRGSGALHLEIGVAGAIILLTGLFLGFIGMARLMGHDTYVAIVEDGVVLHLENRDDFHAWSALRAIVATESGISLEPANAEDKTVTVAGTYGGLSHEALAARLEDWRRKSDWNLKPSDPPKK